MVAPVQSVHKDHRRGLCEAACAILRARVKFVVSPFFQAVLSGLSWKSERVLSMNRWRATWALIILVVLSAVVVPLEMACAIEGSEFQMPHESYLRMTHAANAMVWATLVISVGAGWVLYGAFPTQTMFLNKRPLFVGGSVVCSLLCGLLIFGLNEHAYYRLAETIVLSHR